jgi:hypothetical protein
MGILNSAETYINNAEEKLKQMKEFENTDVADHVLCCRGLFMYAKDQVN